MAAPLPFVWMGEVFRPQANFARRARETYGVGEVVLLAPVEERSDASHKHEFAWLRDAWRSLPEHLTDLYPSENHLRKRALIQGGFYKETVVDVGTKAGALRVAAMMRGDDEFAHVVTRGTVVVRRTAESQSKKAMGPERFQASKQAIIEIVADLIGVEPTTLLSAAKDRGAGRSAPRGLAA